MAPEPPASPLLTSFLELASVSEEIGRGTSGVDFLVLENNDEMYGYEQTELEKRFCVSVDNAIESVEESESAAVRESSQIICIALVALVRAQPAADAYRARMFRYATDWGSEISWVSACSNRLLHMVRKLLGQMTQETRTAIARVIPNEVRNASIHSYFFVESDRHAEESLRVSEILGIAQS